MKDMTHQLTDYLIECYGEEYLDPTYAKAARVGLSMGGNPDFSGIEGAVMAVDETYDG